LGTCILYSFFRRTRSQEKNILPYKKREREKTIETLGDQTAKQKKKKNRFTRK
jgi:hypothetical protein